jgi:hypothetical protein
MNAMQTRAGKQPASIQMVICTCLLMGFGALAGCSFLDAVAERTARPDGRIPLRWQDGTLYLHRARLADYKCVDDLALQCESVSGKWLCHCPRR